MKIISGIYKNRPIKSPNDEKTHPMGSREKLALFNSLAGRVRGAKVLDAFAGTGALGLEALSKGAEFAVFVEKSPKIAKTLAENLEKVLKDEKDKLSKLIITGVEDLTFSEEFDLILADPPYDLYSEALVRPLTGFLVRSGVLCLSMPKTAKTPVFAGFSVISEKNYANAKIAIFQKN